MPKIDITLAPAEVAALTPKRMDHTLIARFLIQKRIRWEPSSSNAEVGELCFNGLRYCTQLDEFGIPELPAILRYRLLGSGPK